ncbi:MAG TPA: class I SAM-dependent methyltransferase [Smithellaceae bacterium]|nr:class I SAM-dependent methyltransferase [Smithellaceae bacterium]HRS89650.1 class I SAM-dependent methyltransferase [Smithellaceae bacterium]HRV25794.1 class I SAM-dependent methyltransferase [Smithellaceae bacterium]
MAEVLDKKMIRQIFRDAHRHQRIGEIIRRFSSNKEDIRQKALNEIDLSSCRNVLELGCAFGAFTEALKGKLHPQAKITGLDILPQYEPFFLEACRHAGYEGVFSAGGVEQIIVYPARSFDLIICSYALYFFPDIIADIARILKKEGLFITITHSECDMQELVEITKNILRKNNLLASGQRLPIENIVGKFSAQNGGKMLAEHFASVRSVDFKNTLIFPQHEIDYLLEYFHFKKSFFLAETLLDKQDIIEQILREIKNSAREHNWVSMCKDDTIFIAAQPHAAKEKP